MTDACIGCKLCYSKCPQKCIDISEKNGSDPVAKLSALRKLFCSLSGQSRCETRINRGNFALKAIMVQRGMLLKASLM